MTGGMEIKSAIQFAEPTIGDSIFNDKVSIKTRANPLVTLDVKGDGVDGILIPNGSTDERPNTNSTYIGCIRYNTTLDIFEGLSDNGSNGAAWIKLGGISDIDGDTKITTESSTGSDDDILKFYAGNAANEKLTIIGSTGNVGIGTSINLNDKLVVNGTINATNFKKGGTEITSTATELNLLDGSIAGNIINNKAVIYGSGGEVNATKLQISGVDITSTPFELNLLDGSIAGNVINNKAVIYGSGGEINATKLQISDVDITSTATELNLLDGSESGNVINSKAVIYGSTGEINATKLQISGVDITSTPNELNLLDGSSNGTIVNNKAVIYGSGGEVNTVQINTETVKAKTNNLEITNNTGNGIIITNTSSDGLVVIGANPSVELSGDTKLFVSGKIKTNNDIISSKLISIDNLTLHNSNNNGLIITNNDNSNDDKVTINSKLEVDEDCLFKKDLEVQGDITIRGQYLQIDSDVSTSESMTISNSGSLTAFKVIQTGAADSLIIYDSVNKDSLLDSEIAFIIKDGGNIGIGTSTPGKTLDVNGTMAVSGDMNINGKIKSGLQIIGETPSTKTPGENSINLGIDSSGSYGYIDISCTDAFGGYIDFSSADGSDFNCRIRGVKTDKKLLFYTNGSTTESLTLDKNGNLTTTGDILIPTGKTLKINNVDQITRLETYIDNKFKNSIIAQLDHTNNNCDNIKLNNSINISGQSNGIIYYDQDMKTVSTYEYLLSKGDYININSSYYRVFKIISPSGSGIDQYGGFTLVDSLSDLESTDDYTSFSSYKKANFEVNLITTGTNLGLNTTGINNNKLNNNIITISESRVYNFNISVRFDLSTGTGYSILYIKVNDHCYRSFYLPSITPINDKASSTLSVSFKLHLNQGDQVSFESNYKLNSCFIDIDF